MDDLIPTQYDVFAACTSSYSSSSTDKFVEKSSVTMESFQLQLYFILILFHSYNFANTVSSQSFADHCISTDFGFHLRRIRFLQCRHCVGVLVFAARMCFAYLVGIYEFRMVAAFEGSLTCHSADNIVHYSNIYYSNAIKFAVAIRLKQSRGDGHCLQVSFAQSQTYEQVCGANCYCYSRKRHLVGWSLNRSCHSF